MVSPIFARINTKNAKNDVCDTDIDRLAQAFPETRSLANNALLTVVDSSAPNGDPTTLIQKLSQANTPLRALLPEMESALQACSLMSGFCALAKMPTSARLDLVFYFVSNNLIQPTYELDDEIARYIDVVLSQRNSLRDIFASDQASAQAIWRYIYGSTVRVGNANALDKFLDAGFDPEETVPIAWLRGKPWGSGLYNRSSALKVALTMGYCKIIELLLRHKTQQSHGHFALPPYCFSLVPSGRLDVYHILLSYLTTNDSDRTQLLNHICALVPRAHRLDFRDAFTLLVERAFNTSTSRSSNELSELFCMVLRSRRLDLIKRFSEQDFDDTHGTRVFNRGIEQILGMMPGDELSYDDADIIFYSRFLLGLRVGIDRCHGDWQT